jgi:hypothetical protein
MCEAIGRDVGELQRIAFGDLTLGHLKEGSVRKLSPEEVESLWQNVADEPTKGPKTRAKSRGNSRAGRGKTR